MIKSIFNLINSHLTVFKHLFKKPVTLEYPEQKRSLNSNFRGKLEVNLSKNGCIGCGICQNVCPSGAISFKKNEKGKVTKYSYDLKKCIFCGNCKFYCPHNAITMSTVYELASKNRNELILEYKGDDNDQ